MRFLKSMMAVLLLTVPGMALSADSGYRQITLMGCINNNNTCYVTVSGDPVGPSGCVSTSIRWNVQTSANGKNTLSLLTAAFLAGKTVNFAVSGSCYADSTGFPTFDYINILN